MHSSLSGSSSISSSSSSSYNPAGLASHQLSSQLDFELNLHHYGVDYLLDRRISRHEFSLAMQTFVEERKKLSLRLADWHNLSDVLVSISDIVFVFVCIFAILIIYGYDVKGFILPLLPLFLSFTWMFGNTVKTGLENFLFVFKTKPYSIGDFVEIKGQDGVFEVVSIQLLTTTFRNLQNKIVIMPNAMLLASVIFNLSRSKHAGFLIPVIVSASVSTQTVVQFKAAVAAFLAARPTNWQPRISLEFDPSSSSVSADPPTVKGVLRVSHQSDFSNFQAIQQHLMELMAFVTETMKKLEMLPGKI